MRVLMHAPVHILYRYHPVQMHAFSSVLCLGDSGVHSVCSELLPFLEAPAYTRT